MRFRVILSFFFLVVCMKKWKFCFVLRLGWIVLCLFLVVLIVYGEFGFLVLVMSVLLWFF